MPVAALRRGGLAGSVVLLLAGVGVLAIRGADSSVTLPAVLAAGFIDGLNPCAIAVLLVFVSAVLIGVERGVRGGERARGRIFAGGGAYVAGMYVTYLALGVGLLGSVTVLQQTHVVGRSVALLALLLGLLAVQEALLPEWGQRLAMPAAFHKPARRIVRSTSLPVLFVAGGLVGLCTVPCSGTIYLATLALLSQRATYLSGIGYLVLYNLMFVAPLLLLLAATTSRPAFRWLTRAQLRTRGAFKLLLGVTTILVGLLTLAAM